MNGLIKLNIIREEFDYEFNDQGFNNLIELYKKGYSDVIEFVKEKKLWDNSIKKIIITNNYEDDIKEQAKKWNREVFLTKERAYSGASKILFNYDLNDPQRIIFFKEYPLPTENYFYQVVFSQIILTHVEKIVPTIFNKYKEYNPPYHLFSDFIKHSIVRWCPSDLSKRLEKGIFTNKNYDFIPSAEVVFNTFTSKLKKSLFNYNNDFKDNEYRLSKFWNELKVLLSNLFSRLIEIKSLTGKLNISNSDYSRISNDVIKEIQNISDLFTTRVNDIDLNNLSASILSFCSYFEIYLTEYKDKDNMEIRLTKNPKDYFVNELIDTHPRIICFMDILGFSNMINEYDEDETSDLLQNIQKAFKDGVNSLLKGNLLPNKDILEFLEYKTFSDNIVISIPYFDNKNDFLTNLNIIITFVRGLQYHFMSLNIFTRGGISIGSYYSDDNILFSKGMIKAYELESKKAIYPRVVIDNSIIERIKNYNDSKLFKQLFNKSFIVDFDEIIFLNPFGQIDTAMSQFENIYSHLEMDKDNNIINKMKTITSNIFQSLNEESIKVDNKIINFIEENKIKNIDIDKVYKKYLWLENYVNWYQKKESRINFEYLELK